MENQRIGIGKRMPLVGLFVVMVLVVGSRSRTYLLKGLQ